MHEQVDDTLILLRRKLNAKIKEDFSRWLNDNIVKKELDTIMKQVIASVVGVKSQSNNYGRSEYIINPNSVIYVFFTKIAQEEVIKFEPKIRELVVNILKETLAKRKTKLIDTYYIDNVIYNVIKERANQMMKAEAEKLVNQMLAKESGLEDSNETTSNE